MYYWSRNGERSARIMYSIKDIYKIGKGPSSSHTMGPLKASRFFYEKNNNCDSFKVILYGSLAKTGKGHHTDLAIKEGLCNIKTEIVYDTTTTNVPHENTMDFYGYVDSVQTCYMRAISVGGGDIEIIGTEAEEKLEKYRHKHFSEIADYCKSRNMRISDYVYEFDDPDIKEYLKKVWQVMQDCIKSGLSTRGILEGGIGVERRAQALFNSKHVDESPSVAENRIVCAYAFAVGEENADFGTVVTAPTCGACSVVPAVLKYYSEKRNIPENKIIDALAVAGIIGNVVKTNASISGAECGCQAEM
jgi:L-serine dehydratase